MKIAVLIKQVPDTEARIRIKGDACGIEEADIKFVISPYDEFAIEEALRTKEKIAAGAETLVLSMGPERALEALRTALAMGIDKGVHIDSQNLTFDSLQTASLLSKVLKERQVDLIFCGKQASDFDNGQVAPMIAELLGIPQILVVEKFELMGDHKGAKVTRRVGGGTKEVYDVNFPAVIACEKGLNSPRYASLPGIMKAKTKPLEVLKWGDLEKDLKPLIEFVGLRLPPERKAGKVIEGEPLNQAAELVRLLREEAKII